MAWATATDQCEQNPKGVGILSRDRSDGLAIAGTGCLLSQLQCW